MDRVLNLEVVLVIGVIYVEQINANIEDVGIKGCLTIFVAGIAMCLDHVIDESAPVSGHVILLCSNTILNIE